MVYLQVSGLEKNFGDKILFQSLELMVQQGDKMALVARNGTGKTSLLKILAGIENPNIDARFTLMKNMRIGYLEQEPLFDASLTVSDFIYTSQNETMQALRNYEMAMQSNNENTINAALQTMDSLNAWDAEARIKEILGQLHIHQLDKKIQTLSGGQKKRLALAQLLIDNPDFLIMDEPTNHLDPPMINWLENYLQPERITLLVVTHDRYFLDNVCNKIVELEHGQLQHYQGNYSEYLEKKNLKYLNEKAQIDRAKNLYRKELDWMRRQPKARSTKAKSRIDNFYKIESVAQKQIDGPNISLQIDAERLGTKIIEFHNVCKAFDDKIILNKFNYKFARFEKVGLAGVNGVGKTTLINMIMGTIAPDSGNIIVGETIKIGYFSQEGIKVDENKRAIEVVTDIAPNIPLKGGKVLSASQLLDRFLFSNDEQYTPVSKLSGGERKRLQLMCVLISNPNFLILDEPTNDLDLHTLMALEEFLEDFIGCVLIVTHDRYFLDKIVSHTFIMDGKGGIIDYNGKMSEFNFDDLLKTENIKNKNTVEENADNTQINISKTKDEKKRLNYNEQRAFDNLPKELEDLEKEKSYINSLLLNETDYKKVMELSNKLTEISEQIELKTMQWLELSERIE